MTSGAREGSEFLLWHRSPDRWISARTAYGEHGCDVTPVWRPVPQEKQRGYFFFASRSRKCGFHSSTAGPSGRRGRRSSTNSDPEPKREGSTRGIGSTSA